MSIDALIKAAKQRGLSGVAVSDHNSFNEPPQHKGFYFIPACEFSTNVGHLLVYFQKTPVNKNLVRDEYGRFFWRDICKFAHDQGALVFLAHPFSPKKIHPDDLFSEIDGIEIHNSRVVHSRIKNANKKAAELAKKLKKPISAGSDAHCPEEVGTSYWECDLSESSMSAPDFEEKLKAALLSGSGKIFAGCASESTVLRCKLRAYKNMGFIMPFIRTCLKLIICLFTKPFKKKAPQGEYLDLKG